MNALGTAIRARRRELNLTQGFLANAAGVGTSQICQIESGQKNPSVETLAAIACALSVPVGDLMSGKLPRQVVELRNQYAGQAMQALILRLAGGPSIGANHDGLLTHLAGEAFAMADAMVAASGNANEPQEPDHA